MTITNPNAYTRDTAAWVHGTFVVSLGVDYATYVEIITNNCKDELFSNDGINPTLEGLMGQVLGSKDRENGPLPVYFSHSKCRDTSLGGNDAINCYYQYNETDDPPHPFTSAQTSASRGMGRVYSETIDDHQQLLYLTFGLPVFNNLEQFYIQALDPNLAELVNNGTTTSLLGQLTNMASAAITTLVKIPSLPLIYIWSAATHFVDTKITKYYDFSNKMSIYYKHVQTIMTHLSVNMGFMNDSSFLNLGTSNAATGGNASDLSAFEQLQKTVEDRESVGIPDIFRTFHMDIYQILQRRASFVKATGLGVGRSTRTTDQFVLQQVEAANNLKKQGSKNPTYDISHIDPIRGVLDGFINSIYNANLYVGFRIEKTTDSSESINNQISQPEIASFINSKSQAARATKFKAMYGRTGFSSVDSIGDIFTGLREGFEKSFGNAAGIEGLTALATGSGMIDIPDVWRDSSVSKHYSFDMRLRAPYGDPISIIQSLYTPLAMILAAAMPRATGSSSYGTPFICRAYSKGMFAVPLGMIESVTIKRGSDTHGWTYQNLPTCIDVNFTIKDLSPCMYMAMGDLTGSITDTFNEALGNNSSFQEYLLTLSGMGLAERSLYILQIKRKVQYLLGAVFDTKLNPYYWAMGAGQTLPARLMSAIIPITKLPRN